MKYILSQLVTSDGRRHNLYIHVNEAVRLAGLESADNASKQLIVYKHAHSKHVWHKIARNQRRTTEKLARAMREVSDSAFNAALGLVFEGIEMRRVARGWQVAALPEMHEHDS